jgi:hypothetical protein
VDVRHRYHAVNRGCRAVKSDELLEGDKVPRSVQAASVKRASNSSIENQSVMSMEHKTAGGLRKFLFLNVDY